MSRIDDKKVDYVKLIELASKYSIVDIAKGNFRGKGTGALRNLENRLRVVSNLAPNSNFYELDKAYDIINEKAKSYYWKRVMKQPERKLESCVGMATVVLQNELTPYPATIKNEPERSNSAKNVQEAPINKKGKNTLLNIALVAALGISCFLGGYLVRGNYEREYHQNNKRIEQRVQETRKENKYSLQNVVAPTPAQPTTIAKAESKKQDKEIWENAGIFPQGYCYKKDIPEYTAERWEKKQKRDKRHAPITARVKRNLNQAGDGIWKVVSSPFKFAYNVLTLNPTEATKNVVDMPIGALETVGGGLGTVNGIGEGITRGAMYTITENDTIDNGLGHFWDASIGGDFNKDFHADFIKFWEWGQKYGFLSDIKNNPCKSSIAIVEDALLIWGLSNIGGGDDGGGGGIGGGGSPGRGGGPGGP